MQKMTDAEKIQFAEKLARKLREAKSLVGQEYLKRAIPGINFFDFRKLYDFLVEKRDLRQLEALLISLVETAEEHKSIRDAGSYRNILEVLKSEAIFELQPSEAISILGHVCQIYPSLRYLKLEDKTNQSNYKDPNLVKKRSPMLLSIGLENFKSFEKLPSIDLKPMTVLAGKNSCGKSSILQSLLLLRQTCHHSDSLIALVFKGEWVDLLNFPNVVFNHDETRKIGYDLTLKSFVTDRSVEYLKRLSWPLDQQVREIEKKYGRLQGLPIESSIQLRFAVKPREGGKIVPKEIRVEAKLPDIDDLLVMDISFYGGQSYIPSMSDAKNAHMEYFKFTRLFSKNELPRLKSRFDLKPFFENFIPRLYLFEKQENRYLPAKPFHTVFDDVFNELIKVLRNHMIYLKPLRQEPVRFQPINDQMRVFDYVGLKGENAGLVLLRKKDKKIKFVPHPNTQVQEKTLINALNHWLRELEITNRLEVRERADYGGLEVLLESLSSPSQPISIADVGFGVSQVLPVLVQTLIAPDDAFLIFEQPELHLHPSLQIKLAEFFICMMQTGKRFLIETHSGLFVDALMYYVVEDKTNKLQDQISLNFIKPPEETGKGASIEKPKIDEEGRIENWPPGFFDEHEMLARRTIRARFKK